MDIKAAGNGELILTMKLPGLNKEDVNVDVNGGCLTISSEAQSAHSETSETRSVRERGDGGFVEYVNLAPGTKVGVLAFFRCEYGTLIRLCVA
jgi:HSP20 family molecular chaperone IbpA